MAAPGDTAPICLWSGPRNVSTALMYSFARRDDIQVVDEPLYGHYLSVSGAAHPGRDEVIRSMDCDGDRVMRALVYERPAGATRLFMKHMAHHLVDLDTRFMADAANVLLIRDPADMLPSLSKQLPHATLADTGLLRQSMLFDELASIGRSPVVLDARELLTDPTSVLTGLCTWLGLPFRSSMLRWEPGPRPEDGVWAKHWYHAVHASRGFEPYRAKTDFPGRLSRLLDECRPHYERLYRHALRAARKGEQT